MIPPSADAAAVAVGPPASGGALARNAFWLLVGQAATTILSVVLSGALGRHLRVDEFGTLYVVTSMTAFALVFADWGQGPHVIAEVARHPDRAGRLLGTALALRLGGGAAVAAASVAAAWALGYDGRTLAFVALMAAANLPLFLAQGIGLAFRGVERMENDAGVNVLGKALAVGLTVPVLLLGGTLAPAILAQGTAGLGALALAALLLRRLGLPPLRWDRSTAGELLAAGTPILTMGVVVAAQPYLDSVLLSKLASPASVGTYAAAKYLMGTLLAPAAIVGTAAYPRLSRAAGDPQRFREELRAALRPLVGLGALGAVGTWAFAAFAIDAVYGPGRYPASVSILHVFAPALLLFYVDWTLANAILAAGRARWFAAAKLGALGVCAALDLVLVPACEARLGNGGLGVVLGFAASELLVLAAALAILPRGSLDRSLGADVARAVVAAAGTLGVLLVVPAPPLVGVVICVATFTALATALGLLRGSDLALARGLLARSRPGPEAPPA